ncbi:MAG: hypothetical protein ACYC0X_34330 [Pirellulaceae bacterium]
MTDAGLEHLSGLVQLRELDLSGTAVTDNGVLSLDETRMGGMEIKFHRLPSIRREGIILPAGLLERVERQTIRFSALSEQLLASGRHLKRGIL